MSPETTEPTAFVLPAELRTALLTYLMNRPYAEVAQGVQALHQLQALQPAPEA